MAGAPPVTTIPPFADRQELPECAVRCDALYAANGGCVPPAAPTAANSQYTACFCAAGQVSAASTATDVVCANVCDQAGAKSVASWFQDVCNVKRDSGSDSGSDGGNGSGSGSDSNNQNGGDDSGSVGGNGDTTDGGNGAAETSGITNSQASTNKGDGGDWLSNHYQWVIMIVIIVFAIIVIWIGACIWRRRYLKKKDRQSSLPQKHSGSASRPSWGPPVTGQEARAGAPTGGVMTGAPPAASDHGSHRGSRGFFGGSNRNSVQQSIIEESEPVKEKKRWTLGDRT